MLQWLPVSSAVSHQTKKIGITIMKRIKKAVLLLLAVTVPLATGFIFLSRKICFPDYVSSVYSESSRELDNPYIGWYRIYTYSLSDDGVFDPSQLSEQEYGPGLALLEFNLHNYADSPVSDTGLRQLDDILTAWRSTGRQLIVRFLYDWDGNALEQEPEDLSLILEHMSQTAEVINRHSDRICILQGIFVGAWGEMHSSSYTNTDDMRTLINHLASVTDPDIYLAVRTPEQWRTITQDTDPLSAQEAFDGSLAARLGLFNDGCMGSDTDLGTYAAAGAPFSPSGLEKRSRQAELLFQNELCCYVPNGGEVVISNPYNDFPAAVETLAHIHISYLNSAYDEAVLSKWKESTWQGGDLYDGMNGYDYISRHLGYRYVLRSSDFIFTPPWADTASLSLVLENVGFSGSYRAFDVSLTLKRTGGNQEHIFPIQTDTRFWIPGEDIRIGTSFEIQELATGTYEVFLDISDPVSGFPIYLANEESDDAGGCYVGSLTISKFPQWDFIISTLIGKSDDASVRSALQQ